MQRRIPSLDGLRAISILMVLYGHAVGTDGFPVRYRSLGLAESGVKVFFIISGFLITKLLLTELEANGRISLTAFYRRRVLRIFPAFYTYWLVMLLLSVGGLLAIPWKDFVYAATYTINYVMNRPWYLGHLWSLAVEEQFYALWPLTLALLGRRRGFWVASSVLLIVPPLRVAQLYLIPSHQQGITEEFHTIADCIATGCLLAGLAGWSWSHERYRRFLGSSQFWLVPCALVLALILGIHPRVKWLIGIPLFNLAVALSIDRWTRFSDADIVGKFLNWKPLAFIGALSYSLYLWQQPFFDHQSHHFWNAFPFNITAAFLMALTSYYLVERPFLALRYGRARPRPALEASTAPAAGASSPESGPGAVTSGGDVI